MANKDNPATNSLVTERLLRWKDVEPIVGICRSHAHQLIARGLFPRPRKIVPGGRACVWPESEIAGWMQQRILVTGDKAA